MAHLQPSETAFAFLTDLILGSDLSHSGSGLVVSVQTVLHAQPLVATPDLAFRCVLLEVAGGGLPSDNPCPCPWDPAPEGREAHPVGCSPFWR